MRPGTDYIGVGVGVILVGERGSLFLAQRGPQASNECGLWEFPWVSPTYVGHIVSGSPTILEPGKCTAIGWYALDEVPEELTMVSRQNLQHYREWMAE